MVDHYAGHPAVPAAAGAVGGLLFSHDDHGISSEPSSAGGTGGDPLSNPRSGGEHPSSTGKAARQSGLMICQVENCHAALEGLKEYHQRYKVCERHLKLDFIEQSGQKLRFCQQCGRFQPLEEFDDSKRSCRVRLQRHNARRRKRPREAGGGGTSSGGGGGARIGAGVSALGVGGGNGVSSDDVAVMQEALHFASATLMQTTAQSSGLVGAPGHGVPPEHIDDGEDSVLSAAGIAGLPFGAQLSSMPFVPSPAVMTLLLKGYAGMFHYSIDTLHLRPRAEPSSLQALSGSMDAAAAAAAAAAAVARPLTGGAGGGVGAMEGAAGAAGMTDAEGAAAAQQLMAAFHANSHEYSAAAAEAVAAATGGMGRFAGVGGPGDVYDCGSPVFGDGAAAPDAAAVAAAAAVMAAGQRQMQRQQQHEELVRLGKVEKEEEALE